MKKTRLTTGTMLAGVTPIAGGHCESSAILNALLYLGYPVTECMITGAGGALDFTFEKGAFPFIGARNKDMRERFFEAAGIAWHLCPEDTERAPDAGWTEISALFARGLPVILRVDMRYLPYRHDGKYGSAWTSFGWHMITLFGIDPERETAFVSDTEFPLLQEISLADLHRARTSRTKTYPPHGEYCWAEKAPEGYMPDWPALAARSLELVTANYERGALAALEQYGEDLENLESFSRQAFLLPAVLEYMAGNIEDFGTGGASFRILYRDFLAAASANAGIPGLTETIPLAEDAIAAWHELAKGFRALAPKIKGMNKADRQAAYARLRAVAENLSKTENRLYTGLKRMRREN